LAYREIEGWLTGSEATTLYDLAHGLPQKHPVIVEIGSWLGKSSLILAKGLQDKCEPILYCIDPFPVDGDDLYSHLAGTMGLLPKEQFIINMKKNRVYDRIRLLHGYSYDFAASFSDEIDLLFIDGDHTYDSAIRDYADWSPFLKPGGAIVFHDVSDAYPGIVSAVKEVIFDNPSWLVTLQIDSLLVATKVRGSG
jgi:predicted O-methyltransferase YrrM